MIRWIVVVLLLAISCSASYADELVAGLAKDLAAGNEVSVRWNLQSATSQPAKEGELPSLQFDAESTWRIDQGRLIAEPSAAKFAVASYTVPPGGGGFYAIKDSLLRRSGKTEGRVELRVFVRRHDGRDEPPLMYTCPDANELFDFDTFLGYVDVGDSIQIAIGPDGDATGDEAEVDCSIVRTPAYTVSTFGAASAGWAILRDVPAGSLSARITAWNTDEVSSTLMIKPAADRETIAAFRVPHSGYYALHDSNASATSKVEARIYAGRSTAPRNVVTVNTDSTSLACDVGYVDKGDVVYVAFANAGNAEAQVEFAGTIVEWAPRTPPLRVARGGDGYVDVFEPTNPLTAIDVPLAKWVTVPNTSGDASDAIRQAFEKAKSLQAGDGYAGVRLERGAIYSVASEMAGGDLFALKDLRHIVFDGNGATLNVTSKEFPRQGIRLFQAINCHGIVLGDFTVTATSVPFAIGEVIDVGPNEGGKQTVTFRLEPGSLDPLGDIARNGNATGYCYDPNIPGRFAVGAWTDYPGASKNGEPQIQATADKGIFRHIVTRTNQSISVGAKWAVKNKGAGLAYLTTRGGTEDVTLWKVTGRASGGGLLYFWTTSRINILDCSFEPAGENWIGSSSDAVHGRGREGVWIEDTTIRGVCEDVMNTYGQTMVVTPDHDPSDNVYSIRMLIRPSAEAGAQFRAGKPPGAETVALGEKLVFFNPKTGHVLGHGIVRDVKDGRFTLSTNIPDIDTWQSGDERNATTVYNTAEAARFVVRDSRFMDSMRFGIFVKARGGALFGNTFDGFTSPAVFVANEPEWPEGPPGTHMWIQGNTFSQNNFGYMSRNRAFLAVDPADISIYTRHLRANPKGPIDHTSFITRGQYANSHVKIIGNTFHDWRGGGISVRNARNVRVEDNLFLPPADDDVMRKALARDPIRDGHFAAIYFDSVDGAQVRGNRFAGLPEGDHSILRDQAVNHILAADNQSTAVDTRGLDVRLTFSEWFGTRSEDTAREGKNSAELQGAVHGPGRLGGGLVLDGKDARAVLRASPEVGGKSRTQFSLAVWVRSSSAEKGSSQVLYSQADANRGVVLAIDNGRLIGGVWQDEQAFWLDLGPVLSDTWQHVSLVFNGAAGTLRAFMNGIEAATAKGNVPAQLDATNADAVLGAATAPVRIAPDRIIPVGSTNHAAIAIDEFHLFSRALSPTDVCTLSLRLPTE